MVKVLRWRWAWRMALAWRGLRSVEPSLSVSFDGCPVSWKNSYERIDQVTRLDEAQKISLH